MGRRRKRRHSGLTDHEPSCIGSIWTSTSGHPPTSCHKSIYINYLFIGMIIVNKLDHAPVFRGGMEGDYRINGLERDKPRG